MRRRDEAIAATEEQLGVVLEQVEQRRTFIREKEEFLADEAEENAKLERDISGAERGVSLKRDQLTQVSGVVSEFRDQACLACRGLPWCLKAELDVEMAEFCSCLSLLLAL